MNYHDLSYTDMERLINEWVIGDRAERDRAILKRKFLDGLTFEALAEEFQLSVQGVKAIVRRRKTDIFKHIPG